MEKVIKIVNGITYEQTNLQQGKPFCSSCVAFKDNDATLCDELITDDCSLDYVFKQADVQLNNIITDESIGIKVELMKATDEMKNAERGVKYDDGKTLYTLIPPYALEAVAKNLTDGLKKYPSRNNWMLVDNAQERYLDALYRHLEAHRKGEVYDKDNINPETTHMSAVAVNAMFLLELMLNPELNKGVTNEVHGE